MEQSSSNIDSENLDYLDGSDKPLTKEEIEDLNQLVDKVDEKKDNYELHLGDNSLPTNNPKLQEKLQDENLNSEKE